MIPARGQRSLAVEIGATAKDAYAACDLTFRLATSFAQADRIAAFCWIKKGSASLAFRFRDARGQVFETTLQPIRQFDRWVRLEADLTQEKVRRISVTSPPRGAPLPASQPSSPWDEFGDHAVVWPIEIRGFRIATPEMGQQVVFVDDIQVEHRVESADAVRGDFEFDKPTKLYHPGAVVAARIVFENRSRSRPLRLSVDLAWLRPDGTTLKTQSGSVQLPASGVDFRARQSIDFSLKIDEPGLYRLVAHAREPRWPRPNTFETSIAVLPSNRGLSRGRSTFFGVRTNLLREPRVDQLLEIEVVREIGAHLLVLDTPWRLIEAKRDGFNFGVLDPLVDALAARGIAVMLSLTDPPEWVVADPSAIVARQTLLLETLAAHFADKVQLYQPLPLNAAAPLAEQIAAVTTLQTRVTAMRPGVRVVSPSTLVAPNLAANPTETAKVAPAEWAYETSGSTQVARQALWTLGGVADGDGRTSAWTEAHRWFHTAAPLVGAGHASDAQTALAFFVEAASTGVAGLVWHDLRDDDADPRDPSAQNGLLQRDFSPKATLWGLASAVGILTGLRHAGGVHGAPDDYSSSLFVGSDRQMALLQPRPNRIRAATLAPIRGVAGTFSAQDFERRGVRLLESAAPPLLLAPHGPLAVTLALETAQPQPQIGFAKPWLRLPSVVFADPERPFTIDVDAPMKLQRSYLQVIPAADAPFESSVTARALKGETGETLTTEVKLSPKSGGAAGRSSLVVKLSLEGQTIEIPVEVRPALAIGAQPSAGQAATAAQRVGALAPQGETRASAAVEVYAMWTPTELLITLHVEDDQQLADAGDCLQLGVALESTDVVFEVALRDGPQGALVERAFVNAGPAPEGWQVLSAAPTAGAPRVWRVTIPATAFGVERFAADRHVLLAARYEDRDGPRAPATILAWGGGLDGNHSSADYVWLRLRN